jgi:PST family polysaccharide transporter
MALTFASGGLNTGVTRGIAANRESDSSLCDHISAALRVTVLFSLISSFLIILFSGFLSRKILGSVEFRTVFLIFGGTLSLYALNNLFLAILNGFKEFRKYVVVNIVTSITGMAFSIILVLIWNIKGALISYVTYQSVILIVTVFMVRKSGWFKPRFFKNRLHLGMTRELLGFSAMTFVSALVLPAAQLIVRSYLTGHLSLDSAGIWEGMNRISAIYLMVVTMSLSVYYLPKLAETKTDRELRAEIFRVMKFFIPFMVVAVMIIFFLRDVIILALFTADFSEMRGLFGYQLTGDLFKMATWIIAYQMWARRMTGLFITTEILFNATLVLLSIVLVRQFSLVGATMAYMINYMLCFFTMVIIFRKQLLHAG